MYKCGHQPVSNGGVFVDIGRPMSDGSSPALLKTHQHLLREQAEDEYVEFAATGVIGCDAKIG